MCFLAADLLALFRFVGSVSSLKSLQPNLAGRASNSSIRCCKNIWESVGNLTAVGQIAK